MDLLLSFSPPPHCAKAFYPFHEHDHQPLSSQFFFYRGFIFKNVLISPVYFFLFTVESVEKGSRGRMEIKIILFSFIGYSLCNFILSVPSAHFPLGCYFLYLPPGTVMESWSQVSSWHMNNECKMLRAKYQQDLRGIKTKKQNTTLRFRVRQSFSQTLRASNNKDIKYPGCLKCFSFINKSH